MEQGACTILPAADTRMALTLTVEPYNPLRFAGQRPWPRFGRVVDDTRVIVYKAHDAVKELNVRDDILFPDFKVPPAMSELLCLHLLVFVPFTLVAVIAGSYLLLEGELAWHLWTSNASLKGIAGHVLYRLFRFWSVVGQGAVWTAFAYVAFRVLDCLKRGLELFWGLVCMG